MQALSTVKLAFLFEARRVPVPALSVHATLFSATGIGDDIRGRPGRERLAHFPPGSPRRRHRNPGSLLDVGTDPSHALGTSERACHAAGPALDARARSPRRPTNLASLRDRASGSHRPAGGDGIALRVHSPRAE